MSKEHSATNPNEASITGNQFKTDVERMQKEAKPYSFQEYLALASEQALLAVEEGNYGVGAVYVLRTAGQEYVIGGRNGIISRKNTSLHAEQDAINAVESLARGEDTYANRVLLNRPAPHQETERMIVTSLEPCPMCTARILTHKVDKTYIGSEDDFAGAMLGDREQALPILWRKMREGLIPEPKDGETPKPMQVITPDRANPNSLNYIPEKFIQLPLDIFFSTREAIDAKMGSQGLSPDLSALPQTVARFAK